MGFKVPATLFTSNKESAAQFLQTHDTCVVKSLSNTFPINQETGAAEMFFTHKIEKGEIVDLNGLNLAPAIFQEAITSGFDIRVTIVGKKVFAAAIHIDIKEKKFARTLDWRAGDYAGKQQFEPFELPASIADRCIRYIEALGLCYGAIDLIQDMQGDIWFLENNPNGQWAFVEAETGQEIGKALAHLLEAHQT
jgi:glutathione synthase/RimK-type ligase-like ATP-grasp enzyme